MNELRYSRIQKVTLTSVLITLAVVVNLTTSITVPVAGVPILRISFSGVFLRLVAFLFGPLFAGASGAITDIVMVLLRPQGSYLWPLTVIAFAKNLSIGYLWMRIKRLNFKVYNACYLCCFGAMGFFGAANIFVFHYYPESAYTSFFKGIGSKTGYMSIGLVCIAASAMVIYLASYMVYARRGQVTAFERYLKIVVTTGAPSIIFTTINTVILQKYFLLPDKSFILLWIPRAVEEIMLVIINAYLLIIILNIYEKYAKK